MNNHTTQKTHKLTLEFDSKEAAEQFQAHWLDGGGDGGGNLDWNTTKWNKAVTSMRIKGTGYAIEWDGDEMIVMTPEAEAERFNRALVKYK